MEHILKHKEPYFTEKYSKYNNFFKRTYIHITEGKKGYYFPTLSSCVRPGIAEDALLRQNIRDYIKNKDYSVCYKDFYFTFYTESDIYKWFTEQELEILKLAGATISSWLVDEKKVVRGYRQCMVLNE